MGHRSYQTFDSEAPPLLNEGKTSVLPGEEEVNLQIFSKPKSRYFKTYQVSLLITILIALGFYFAFYEGLSPHEKLKKQIAEAGERLVIIEFVTEWCGPCKLMKKNVTNLEKCLDEVVFLQSDIEKDKISADEFEIDTLPAFKFFYNNSRIPDTVRGYDYDELSIKAYQYYEEIAKNPDKKPEKAKGRDWKCNHWWTWWWCPEEEIDVCLKNYTMTRNENKTKLPIHKISTPEIQTSQLKLVKLQKNLVFNNEPSQKFPKISKSANIRFNKTNKKENKLKRRKIQMKMADKIPHLEATATKINSTLDIQEKLENDKSSILPHLEKNLQNGPKLPLKRFMTLLEQSQQNTN